MNQYYPWKVTIEYDDPDCRDQVSESYSDEAWEGLTPDEIIRNLIVHKPNRVYEPKEMD